MSGNPNYPVLADTQWEMVPTSEISNILRQYGRFPAVGRGLTANRIAAYLSDRNVPPSSWDAEVKRIVTDPNLVLTRPTSYSRSPRRNQDPNANICSRFHGQEDKCWAAGCNWRDKVQTCAIPKYGPGSVNRDPQTHKRLLTTTSPCSQWKDKRSCRADPSCTPTKVGCRLQRGLGKQARETQYYGGIPKSRRRTRSMGYGNSPNSQGVRSPYNANIGYISPNGNIGYAYAQPL
jgi:hypothetical protein